MDPFELKLPDAQNERSNSALVENMKEFQCRFPNCMAPRIQTSTVPMWPDYATKLPKLVLEIKTSIENMISSVRMPVIETSTELKHTYSEETKRSCMDATETQEGPDRRDEPGAPRRSTRDSNQRASAQSTASSAQSIPSTAEDAEYWEPTDAYILEREISAHLVVEYSKGAQQRSQLSKKKVAEAWELFLPENALEVKRLKNYLNNSETGKRFQRACSNARKRARKSCNEWVIHGKARMELSKFVVFYPALDTRHIIKGSHQFFIETVPCTAKRPPQGKQGQPLVLPDGNESKKPSNSALIGNLDDYFKLFNCSFNASAIELMIVAKEQLWDVYYFLTKNARGHYKELCEEIWATAGNWNFRCEELRALILLQDKREMHSHFGMRKVAWSEKGFGSSTLLSFFHTCDGCAGCSYGVEEKNINFKLFELLAGLRIEDQILVCNTTICLAEEKFNPFTIVLPRPVIRVILREADPKPMSRILALIPKYAKLRGETYMRAVLSLYEVYRNAERSSHQFLLSWLNKKRNCQLFCDSTPSIWSGKFEDSSHVLGYVPTDVIYINVQLLE